MTLENTTKRLQPPQQNRPQSILDVSRLDSFLAFLAVLSKEGGFSAESHTSLHPFLSGSAVSVCPLTGLREVCVTRQQHSLHVEACTLAGAADQSPPTLAHRQARPITAELAPARVSSSQSRLSLLGPSTYCRGGILTRSRIKERRLRQELAEVTL